MPVADPADVLDYTVDWSSWLSDAETISASTWVVRTGITQTTPSPSNTTTSTTIWLTGGTVGAEYDITNHITTNQGRQVERTFVVNVQNR